MTDLRQPIKRLHVDARRVLEEPLYSSLAGSRQTTFMTMFEVLTAMYSIVRYIKATDRERSPEAVQAAEGVAALRRQILHFNEHRAAAPVDEALAFETVEEALAAVGVRASVRTFDRYDAGKATETEAAQARTILEVANPALQELA
jgi:hypothetical protein